LSGAEARLRAQLIALLDRDVERCPHGCPIGIDLALPDGGASLDLDLLAGPAMGSGRAPWTRALLAALERHLAAGAVVADVGTGTGILGLVALRRGAARVHAVDVDQLACAIARRNARHNRLDDRMAVSTALVGGGYDLGIVSLGSIAEMPAVLADTARRVRPGGVILASPAEGEAERAQLHALLASLRLGVVDEVEVNGWFVPVAVVSSPPP
jgi:ribosomal protein L11 methyltransferase